MKQLLLLLSFFLLSLNCFSQCVVPKTIKISQDQYFYNYNPIYQDSVWQMEFVVGSKIERCLCTFTNLSDGSQIKFATTGSQGNNKQTIGIAISNVATVFKRNTTYSVTASSPCYDLAGMTVYSNECKPLIFSTY